MNVANKDDKELFIKDNIEEINKKKDNFKSVFLSKNKVTAFIDDTDIINYLNSKLYRDVKEQKNVEKLMQELEKINFTKNKIVLIANKHLYYKKSLEKFYEKQIFKKVYSSLKGNSDDIATYILSKTDLSKQENRFIGANLKNISTKVLELIAMNGFSVNINDTNPGIMMANAGDSAQYLFLARCILAGYNASNVDVRSSRYDAIVDFEGKLIKVQIKGISGNTISFQDRPRGGKGIDYKNARNIGKRITSADCDIYAAVDKQIGIIYLIPMKEFADKLSDNEAKTVKLSKVEKYKENWSILGEI